MSYYYVLCNSISTHLGHRDSHGTNVLCRLYTQHIVVVVRSAKSLITPCFRNPQSSQRLCRLSSSSSSIVFAEHYHDPPGVTTFNCRRMVPGWCNVTKWCTLVLPSSTKLPIMTLYLCVHLLVSLSYYYCRVVAMNCRAFVGSCTCSISW